MADAHFSTDNREVAKLFVAYQLTRDIAENSAERLTADQMREEFLANLKMLQEKKPTARITSNIPPSSGSRSAR